MNLFVLPFFSFTCCCYSFCNFTFGSYILNGNEKSHVNLIVLIVCLICVCMWFSLSELWIILSTMGWRMLYWTLNMYTGKNVQEFTDLTNFFFLFFFSRRYPLRLVEQMQLWKRQYDEEWPLITLWIKFNKCTLQVTV